MVMSEKELKWDGVHLDLRAGDQQKPDYVKLNPKKVVPTLMHEGTVVIESNVICEYLDDAFEARPVRPSSPAKLAQMRLWTKQIDEGVHASTGVISNCIAFRHQHLQKTPEQIETWLNNIPDPVKRQRMRNGVELGMDSPDFKGAVMRYEKLLDDMEAALKNGPWLLGDEYSLADISYAAYMARLKHLGLGERIEARPHVAAWAERLLAKPSFKEGIEDWFDPKYLALFESQRGEAKAKIRDLFS